MAASAVVRHIMGSLSADTVSSLNRVTGLQFPRGMRGRASGRLRYPVSEQPVRYFPMNNFPVL